MTRPGDPAPALPRWLAADLPFARTTVMANGRRIHAIDDGPEDGPVVVMQHGNPTWCFLWRKVIDEVRKLPDGERLRIVAPDLFGFGYSDKPRESSAHSLVEHVATIDAVLRALGVRRAFYVGQDWGGPIAAGCARLASQRGDEPRGFLWMNTAVLEPARPPRATAFHRFAQRKVVADLVFLGTMFPVPVMSRVQGDPRSIGWHEMRAYALPFAQMRDRAGPLALARMVPHAEGHPTLTPMDEIGAWASAYRGPVSLLWGTKDPILGRSLARHQKAFPRATVETTEAGHFLQEEVPGPIARAIMGLVARGEAV